MVVDVKRRKKSGEATPDLLHETLRCCKRANRGHVRVCGWFRNTSSSSLSFFHRGQLLNSHIQVLPVETNPIQTPRELAYITKRVS